MSPDTLIQLVEVLALLLWCHAAVLAVDWLGLLRRAPQHERVGMFVNLLGALVPIVVLYIAVVFAGSVFGLRSVVVFLALIVPGGLVVALRLDLRDLRPSKPALELRRMAVTLGLALVLLGYWRLRG